ncbi:MAG: M23 family metallopeptidase [Gammaproteobacteria bacterium]|nr:M23 family metallopeptidase [Gammaproteobacteria bacterium]
MQKTIEKLSTCILVVALCSLLPSCSTLNPAPIEDRSLGISDQLSGSVRTYRYVVKSGDTLYAISKLHGLTVDQIAEMNGLKPPYTIVPNQILVVTPSRVLWHENVVEAEEGRTSVVSASRQGTQSSQPFQETTPKASQSTAKSPQSRSTTPNRSSIQTTQTKPVATKNAQNKSPTATTVSTGETEISSTSSTVQPMESSDSLAVAETATRNLGSLPKGWEWPVNTRPTKPKGSDDGLTYFLNRGTNVVAAASGRVSYAGVALSDYRYMVLVKTSDNYVIQYDFNSELTVKENDIVSKGQPLIRISSKGVPKSEDEERYRRLYFAIWHKAVPQDPNKLIGR